MTRFALPAWTLLVWVPRVRNILADDELGGPAQGLRLGWATVFIVFAVGAVVLMRTTDTAVGRRWLQGFVVWTVGFWSIRGVQIALADHSAGFIAVHTVLAVVSITLGLLAWPRRAGDGASPPAPALADHG